MNRPVKPIEPVKPRDLQESDFDLWQPLPKEKYENLVGIPYGELPTQLMLMHPGHTVEIDLVEQWDDVQGRVTGVTLDITLIRPMTEKERAQAIEKYEWEMAVYEDYMGTYHRNLEKYEEALRVYEAELSVFRQKNAVISRVSKFLDEGGDPASVRIG